MTLRPQLAYLPWQARDLLVRALAPLLVFAVVGGLPMFFWLREQEVIDLVNNGQQADFVRGVFESVSGLAIVLGAFLFMSQSVALDRDRQYLRFLFSQPVAPHLFYLQRFLVGLVLFLAVYAPVPLIIDGFLVDVATGGTLAAMAIALTLVGGLTVLAGAISHRDGLVVILVYIVSRTMQQLSEQDLIADWLDPVVAALPPIQVMSSLNQALIAGASWEWSAVFHSVGYGLGMLAVGLYIIRRAPLVR